MTQTQFLKKHRFTPSALREENLKRVHGSLITKLVMFWGTVFALTYSLLVILAA